MALPRAYRLPASHIPQLLKARAFSNTTLTVKVKKEGVKVYIAVIVPTKVAPQASLRNSLRRRITEGVQKLIPSFLSGYEVLVIARSKELPPMTILQKEMKDLFVAAGAIV